MIIYPPFIGDTIPAFTKDKIVIPFSQNPAVSFEEVTSFGLMVKEYNSSKQLAEIYATKEAVEYNNDTKTGKVTFDLTGNNFLQAKQYYKFQMSYSDDNTYNAYSTASIGRCIGDRGKNFGITVLGMNQVLDPNVLNIDTTIYIGKYTTSISSEPIYSYRFALTDKSSGEIIQDSGELLHDVDTDSVSITQRTSQHTFKIRYELELGKQYELTYSITTINGYSETKKYTIIKSGQLPTNFNGSILVEQDEMAKENGYVKISIFNNKPYRGSFVIERTSDNKEWNELTKFSITNISDISSFVWKDWSVEQGVEYTYAIRQYSNNQYSERIFSQPIQVNFEHMFLSDGERQLKISYNPKVSSFKNVILEQKTDTIGGQYPFFFRNNQIKYKEIPISGLISYQMDEDNFFIFNDTEIGLIDNSLLKDTITLTDEAFEQLKIRTSALTNYNYAAERKFKLSVLDWLTNGEPKLFRSPAEGNYVVRLMNTSLSPNDTLGRMLHTFSATGYEVCESNTSSLIENGLINLPELQDPEPSKVFQSLDLIWYDSAKKEMIDDIEYAVFRGNQIEGLVWNSSSPNFTDKLIIDNQDYINTTGNFSTPSGMLISIIKIPKNILTNGIVTFTYYPDLEEAKGEDEFAKMVNASEDVLFSAPLGHSLYGENKGILVDYKDGKQIVTSIYKTYVLIVQKDLNSQYTSDEVDNETGLKSYQFSFGDNNIIDCSDGQVRYYYNVDPSIKYEKGLGLHLDVYVRLQTEGVSSRLGQFILGKSRLG